MSVSNKPPLDHADRGRLCILTKSWSEAIEHFKTHFDLVAARGERELHKQESLTRDVYDHGKALVGGGKPAGASRVWRDGLLYPDEPGNHVWKRKMEKELQLLSTPGALSKP